MEGKVFLVGAGPGDPGLLTIRGKKLLERADVIVYDNLVNPLILRHAKKEALLIYAGKKKGEHTLKQSEINRLLVDFAKKGLFVVRLKGGDPFIFGRGAEEAEALAKEGISFEVVPGVSSAVAVPAYAGIPLTHRKISSSITVITGHEDPEKEDSSIRWDKISGTIVILMGIGNIKKIKERLIKEGISPDTPFAIIQNGTHPGQKTVSGRLKEIDVISEKENISPPSVIVIGDVVRLRERLLWFEKKKLFGKRILITREENQAEELIYPLIENGAEVILFPTIKIVPPESWSQTDEVIENIERYEWIIFTSSNGVRYFFSRFLRHRDIRDLKGIKFCAIGSKTAKMLNSLGIKPDLIPEEFSSKGIINCFRKKGIKGKEILLPRAENAPDYLQKELKKLGASVDVVSVYRNIIPEVDEEKKERIKDMLVSGEIDICCFTAGSTFRNLLKILEIEGDEKRYFSKTKIACIGPVTASFLKEKGIKVDIMPKRYDIASLIEAILNS